MVETRLGYERIEKKFEELEEKITKLTQLKSKKNTMGKVHSNIFRSPSPLCSIPLSDDIVQRERMEDFFLITQLN